MHTKTQVAAKLTRRLTSFRTSSRIAALLADVLSTKPGTCAGGIMYARISSFVSHKELVAAIVGAVARATRP